MRRFFRSRAVRIAWKAFQVLFIIGVFLTLVGTVVAIDYIVDRSREVPPLDALEYGQIRTWKQHSEVYSDVAEIRIGIPIDRVRRRLARLDYHPGPREQLEPGTYYDGVAGGDGVLALYPRTFFHPRVRQRSELMLLRFHNGRLVAIEAEGNRRRDVLYLEPELLAELYNIDEQLARQLIALQDVPQNLINAFIAIEDADFYSHPGIHPRRFVVAMIRNVLYGRLYGASTITQQLARNILLTRGKKISRKVKEWILAVRIEKRYSKDEILERYLNFIDFGQRANRTLLGVKEAARYFFDKDVSELTLEECATLAAVPNAPTRYSPVLNPDNALRRRNLVLSQMYRRGFITKEEYARARAKPLVVADPKRRKLKGAASYFTAYIRRLLEARYSPEELYASGLRVYTTLDPIYQEMAEAAVQNHLRKLDAELGYPPYDETRRAVKERRVPPEKLKEYLQAGLVMIEAQTGFVRAYIGGRDFEYVQFDHVTQAQRQAGSAFKPFVYTAAWIQGFRPSDTILDEPWSFFTGQDVWTPKNYHEDRTYGLVTLEEALVRSLNIATAKLMNDPDEDHVGIEPVLQLARRLGIESKLRPYASLALGATEVTPMELTVAYAPFANQGVRVTPIAVRFVVTLDGEIKEENKPLREPVLDPEIAYMTTRVLQGVLDKPYGTGRVARSYGFRYTAAGKTGTTSDYTDAWFIGYTPQFVTGVWVGFDDPNKKTNQPGAKGALPIWANFMKEVLYEDEPFPTPIGMSEMTFE